MKKPKEAEIFKPGPGSDEKNWVIHIPAKWLNESLIKGIYEHVFEVTRSPFIRSLPKYILVKIPAVHPEDKINKFVDQCRTLAQGLKKIK